MPDADNKVYGHLYNLASQAIPLFKELSTIAGFDLPEKTKKKFVLIDANLRAKPQSQMLTRLTTEGGSRRDWLAPFKEAALGHVHEGLTACYYHLRNVESIEKAILSAALVAVPKLQLSGAGVAGGNTRRFDFEYQAFIFAVRRTLEYFAVSVGAFFKREAHRIRTLCDSISNAEPKAIGERVQAKIKIHLEKLSDLLPPKDEEQSVRDQLAHWKSVKAGTFNISSSQGVVRIAFAGGGENIRTWDAPKAVELKLHESEGLGLMTLTPLLKDQVGRVEDLIFGVYEEMGLFKTYTTNTGEQQIE